MQKFFIILLIVHCALPIVNTQWIQQPIPTSQQVQDIHFLDSLHGWLACSNGAANDSGLILYTSTGGTSWITQYSLNSSPLYGIRMVNLSTGFCTGGFQKVLKTTNSGINWININTGFANYLKDISIPGISGDTVYIIDRTSGEGIWKTTNGGVSFMNQYPSAFGNTIFFINNQTGWAEVGNFNLVRTTNGGTNWVTLRTFPGTIGDIFFVNENTGWVNGGDSSGMLKTTNGGLNFISQTLPTGSFGFFDIFMINSNTGWSGGVVNQIHKTTNSGTNWVLYTGMPIYSSRNICFINSMTGWCGSSPFNIAKSTNGGIMGIGQINNEIPKSYSLKQNYPNPFNSQTIIEFSISKESYVELTLYDILGKAIPLYQSKSLLSAGTYKFPVSANDLSSGMYFYKLTVTDRNKNISNNNTKKMILIK